MVVTMTKQILLNSVTDFEDHNVFIQIGFECKIPKLSSISYFLNLVGYKGNLFSYLSCEIQFQIFCNITYRTFTTPRGIRRPC